MRAFVLDAPADVSTRPLSLTDRPDPQPGEGQLRVRVHACGICRTDLHVVEGDLPVRRPHVVPGHQVTGAVDALGDGVTSFAIGERVGLGWLHGTCGHCAFCLSGRENLCDTPELTGWTVDGGFAELVLARPELTYRPPDTMSDVAAAPLLCAGIIGFRALARTGLCDRDWAGARIGIFGFGAAGHIAIQLARARGADVFVHTRDRMRHRALADELGARWVGDTFDAPPIPHDASIIFAPAGEIVPFALRNLRRGGVLVLGGIHMSDIPPLPYGLLYGEREVRSVMNDTRADGDAFLSEAARIGVTTHVQRYAFDQANEALLALKSDAVRGAAVLALQSSAIL